MSQPSALPEDMATLLKRMADRPYRLLVEQRLKALTSSQLSEAVNEAANQVPEEFRGSLESYRAALAARFMVSPLFWQASTCREALANLLEAAYEAIPHPAIRQCHRAPLADANRPLAESLFRWATLTFAEAAARDGKQRKLMGIKRGWLR